MIAGLTAADITSDYSAWIIRKHKTEKKTGRPLVVYLHPCLQTLCRIAAAARPAGALFRHRIGRWSKNSIVDRFSRLREKLNLPKGVTAYGYRHAFATRALLAGESPAIVAELLGHRDTAMVSRHYGHLDQAKQHLLAAVAKVHRQE